VRGDFLGKAVPKGIKSRADFLLQRYPDSFSRDFEKNKEVLNSLGLPFSKQTRNLIAGYISKKKKLAEQG
jgi:small subunit ribosomal protein S17e